VIGKVGGKCCTIISMKTKKLTYLLALTFLFLFSGSSSAGLFSPDDYNECVFENMKDAQNNLAALNFLKACKSKFPKEPPVGASGFFGPKSYEDCVLKYSKGIKNNLAQVYIISTCQKKFKKPTDPDKNSEIENNTKKEDFNPIPDFTEGLDFYKTEGAK